MNTGMDVNAIVNFTFNVDVDSTVHVIECW